MLYSIDELTKRLNTCLKETQGEIVLTNPKLLQTEVMPYLLRTALFAPDKELKDYAQKLIFRLADTLGIKSSPTTALYMAFAQGEISGFCVPAINLRIMPYQIACSIFALLQKYQIGIVIFELARSEMKYTHQSPIDLSLAVHAAALSMGFKGHIFIQGDHYQVSREAYLTDAVGELNALKKLIIESLAARIYNIDIDASTLVDLEKPSVREQQIDNALVTAELTNFIRMHEPQNTPVMIGGEIGHIGDTNSTIADMDAFMSEYSHRLYGKGIGKLSIQTGTRHGGAVDAGGHIQAMQVDMKLIKNMSEHARNKYNLAGIVQHGASTLPKALFSSFPKHGCIEIHLSTGIQNVVFDHMPEKLKHLMYAWLNANCSKERKDDWTDEQFFYRTRKKAIGAFLDQLWELSPVEIEQIEKPVSLFLEELFLSLQLKDTKKIISKYYV